MEYLSTFGPLRSARYDPHEPPPHEQDEAVAYRGGDWEVCLAEAFQQTRVVQSRTGSPFITGVRPVRQLRLIDLRGSWPMTVGASHHINTARKDYCRAWARALRQAWPEADGHASIGINAGIVVTLFGPARDGLGKGPVFDRPLADEAIDAYVTGAALAIGYDVV